MGSTCRDVFSCGRRVVETCREFGDDPDDALQGLQIWPQVVVHGGKLFAMNNRRTYCIKNCNGPQDARIWVKLYLSPHDYNTAKGKGTFEQYYSTADDGLDIELTSYGHKRRLACKHGNAQVYERYL